MADAKIGLATIEVDAEGQTLTFDFDRALAESLIAGTSVLRYGRTWLMGQTSRRAGRVFGRIGYQQAGSVSEIWDPKLKDFKTQLMTMGQTSPFYVDLETRRVAFQLRPSIIDPTTFTSNFQALLNEVSKVWNWKVRYVVRGVPWKDWVTEVDRVTELRITVVKPNPHYDSEFVEQLIEQVRAHQVTLDAKAEKDGGIDIDANWVREALDHAERDRKYGTWTATGEQDGGKVKWKKAVDGQPFVTEGEADPKSGEATQQSLRSALDKPKRRRRRR